MEKDLLIKKVEDINKEVNKIFDMVTDENEISVYKSQLLYAKLNLLSDSLDETMVTLLGGTILEVKWFMLRRTLAIILAIISLITMFINLPVGLALIGVAGFSIHKLNREGMIKSQELLRVDGITKTANEMVTVFDNCYSFLNGRTNSELESKPEKLEDKDLRKIDIANHHIEFVMATGIKEDIPLDIQNVMIKMLQDNLGTDESDLEKLLEIAYKKMISDQKLMDDGMALKREKKDGKKDEKRK